MHRIRPRQARVVAAGLLAMACGDQPQEPDGGAPAVTGTYELTSIAGAALPVTLDGGADVLNGVLRVEPAGTFIRVTATRVSDARVCEREECLQAGAAIASGTWTQAAAGVVVLTAWGAEGGGVSSDTARVSGSRLRLTPAGSAARVWEYERR